MSDTDLEFVVFALQEGVDAFGVSFAETADDIIKVRDFAGKRDRSVHVVAKIERAEAIKNIDGILNAADAIMIARGDLGVQIPLQDVPAVQKKLIHKSNLLGGPVEMLIEITREKGIEEVRADVFTENQSMLKVFRRLGFACQWVSGGTSEAVLKLKE